MITIQYALTIIIGVTAILLAKETRITDTDAGRLLLVTAVMALVVSMPEAMPLVGRLLSALLGGYALHRLVDFAFGPVPYKVLHRHPALLLASRNAYRMQFGLRKALYGTA